MPYCTQDDLIDAYGEEELKRTQPLDDLGVDPVILDTAAVASAIQSATDEINTYVMTRYRLPLGDTEAALLKRRCIDIAMYYLAHCPAGENDTRRRRYEDAVEWLTMLAEGKVLLRRRPDAVIKSEPRREFRIPGNHAQNPYNRPGRYGRFA